MQKSPRARKNFFGKVFCRLLERSFVIGAKKKDDFLHFFSGRIFVFIFSPPNFDHITGHCASFFVKKVFSNCWEHGEKGFRRGLFLISNIFSVALKLFNPKKYFKKMPFSTKILKILKIWWLILTFLSSAAPQARIFLDVKCWMWSEMPWKSTL